MRTCPICDRQYTDDLSFCLEDGTPLVAATDPLTERKTEQFEQETFIRSTPVSPTVSMQPPANSSGRRFGLVAAVGIIGALILGVAGGFAIFNYLGSRETASTSLPASPSPPPAPSDRSTQGGGEHGASPTPTPEITATPTPKQSPPATVAPPSPTPPPEPPVTDEDEPDSGPGGRRVISGGVLNGKAIVLPRPPYPPGARVVRASGTVSVEVLVSEQGRVLRARAVSGHPMLRQAAVQAARNAVFSPTTLGGEPVRVRGVLNINFGAPAAN